MERLSMRISSTMPSIPRQPRWSHCFKRQGQEGFGANWRLGEHVLAECPATSSKHNPPNRKLTSDVITALLPVNHGLLTLKPRIFIRFQQPLMEMSTTDIPGGYTAAGEQG
jgi:hypothetical protein